MFLTLDIAKAHLRVIGGDEDADLALKCDAAEGIAVAHLDRAVYADQAQLNAAIAAAPAALAASRAAFLAADAAAALIEDEKLRELEEAHAFDVYSRAIFAVARIRRGHVINPVILSAMLLILGGLWESRENTVIGVSVASIPDGAYRLLDAYRHCGA